MKKNPIKKKKKKKKVAYVFFPTKQKKFPQHLER